VARYRREGDVAGGIDIESDRRVGGGGLADGCENTATEVNNDRRWEHEWRERLDYQVHGRRRVVNRNGTQKLITVSTCCGVLIDPARGRPDDAARRYHLLT
jgi:hypothetical protein